MRVHRKSAARNTKAKVIRVCKRTLFTRPHSLLAIALLLQKPLLLLFADSLPGGILPQSLVLSPPLLSPLPVCLLLRRRCAQ